MKNGDKTKFTPDPEEASALSVSCTSVPNNPLLRNDAVVETGYDGYTTVAG